MRFTSETLTYVVIMSFLTFSSLMYLLARQGALYRSRAHRRVPRALIDDSFDTALPTMTVLVPSYREEIATVRKTLLSAALQEYPYLRIVLLLDDPPHPSAAQHLALLERARGLAAELTRWLEPPRQRFARLLDEFERVSLVDSDPTQAQMAQLAGEYGWAADWLTERADAEPDNDHVDAFFADHVLRALAERLRGRATRAARSDRGRRDRGPGPDAAVASSPGLDVPGRADLVRAQALCIAVARFEQGDEPQQLSGPDGTQLRAPTEHLDQRRRPRPGAGGQHWIDPDPGCRLHPHPRRRQRSAAGVLPAAGLFIATTGKCPGRGRPDAVLGLPGFGHPHRAAVRCNYRFAAHRSSRNGLSRRDVLGRRQCRHPQKRPRGHRRDRARRRA